MAKSLLIVESPAKAKTLNKYLGKNFIVKASVGHVKDLPKSKLGVEINGNNFLPQYVAIDGKEKVVKEISKAAKDVENIYLAPDPDREGEAIAWHLAEELEEIIKKGKGKNKSAAKNIYRVLFFEITKKAVKEGIAKAGKLNRHKYEAQQARRILDRLVGYRISPILWEKVSRGLSAGRVQSVAVRIICQREEEIKAFNQEEYWSIEGIFANNKKKKMTAKLLKVGKEKFSSSSEKESNKFITALKKEKYAISKLTKKEVKRNPLPPFITSTLQQEAIRRLHFTAKKTMTIAQRLYEGMDLGGTEEGLITYMRTDSCRISDQALNETRQMIAEKFGKDYLPPKPFRYKVRKDAHDAHEAIRPTSVLRTPEKIKKYLGRDELKLYKLIWSRFVACQMNPAIFEQTSVDISGGKFLFRANGRVQIFAGHLTAYQEVKEEEAKENDEAEMLPPLKEGEKLSLEKVAGKQHFTQPPPRFSEASLVREMEEKGIGRPSTYASILSNIVARKYVEKQENRFSPTQLGNLVNGLLIENFPKVLDIGFTAMMEEQLDQVEFGEKDWQKVLGEFNKDFEKTLAKAKSSMRDVKREEIPTDYKCEKCKKPMVVKWGRNGYFLACSAYPDCKSTKEIKFSEDNKIEIVEPEKIDEKCPNCGAAFVLKFGRFGRFLACSKYPECKTTKSVSVGVKCPRKGCKGHFTEKRSRKGKVFYGCSNYPKCDQAEWYKPVNKKCPNCKSPYLLEKQLKSGVILACPNKDCGYKKKLDEE